MNNIKKYINKAQRIVVFSGAGFSTKSGIPDFRSNNGIYQINKYPFSSEVMLSHDFFMNKTETFYQFYRNEMIHLDALPNGAHLAVAKLEKLGKLEAIITQNIDGLHQMAGNNKILELHGSIHRNYCMKCHASYPLDKIVDNKTIPLCDKCGSIIKPDVVLYQEGLNETMMMKAIDALQKADLLIVAGTSLVVYPAAGLLQYYDEKKPLILINKDETSADHRATLISRNSIDEELAFLNKE